MKTFLKKRSLFLGVALAAVAALCLYSRRAVRSSDRVAPEALTSVKSEVPAWVAPEVYRRNVGRPRPNHERSLRMAESNGWLTENFDPPRCKVPDEECQRIKAVFDKMAEAYERGQTNAVRSLFVEMPSCVSNVSSFVYPELLGDFYRQVRKRFLALEEPLEFDSSEKFRTYLDSSMLASEILGDLDLHHQRYLIVPRFDSQVVRQLKRYKTKFEIEQKPEMALYADQRLKAWCEKIDSADGYLHRYMIFQVSLQLIGDLDWRWEELLGCIRHEADTLVAAGYKPKWLDEEFPESVEWDRKVAAEHERRRQAGRRPPVKNTDDGVRRNGVRQEK